MTRSSPRRGPAAPPPAGRTAAAAKAAADPATDAAADPDAGPDDDDDAGDGNLDAATRPPGDDDADPRADGTARRPSKTRRKQDSHDLQALGEALAELPAARLDALPMPEILRDALRELPRIRSHEGRRRHAQYVGKLMRRADPAPLREAVAAARLGRAHDALALHRAEHWRAALLADDEALSRWAVEHPGSDLQQLRSLVRAARKDAAARPEDRSGRAYRELFRHLRAATQDPAATAPADEDPA